MMTGKTLIIRATLLTPAFGATSASAQAVNDALAAIEVVWSNPSGHVHIKIAPCDPHFCGTVFYANDKARADAAKVGTTDLVGTNLFHSFQPDAKGGWDGKVLVPDLNKSVAGRIQVVDASTLDVEGCMFGHLACKDQKWTRVE
jgi:uncharacterized protein (DUF2147 family)